MKDALERIEKAVATRDGLATHAHGTHGLTGLAAQDMAAIAEGLDDKIAVALRKGCLGALEGHPEDGEALIVHQKTWQIRHVAGLARAKLAEAKAPPVAAPPAEEAHGPAE